MRVATTSRLILYSTSACHLCEQALALVHRGLPPRWSVEEVDISESDELFDRYGTRIPVLRVEHSGRELNWPFNGEQLGRLLAEEHPAGGDS